MYTEGEPESQSILPQKFLAIVTREGRLILDRKPYFSFIHFIEYVGLNEVASLDLKVGGGMPLVSKTRINLRDYNPAKDGWYVYTTMNLKEKIAIIHKIGTLIGCEFICLTKPEYY